MSGVVNFGTSKSGREVKGESLLAKHEQWCDMSFLSMGMDCPLTLGGASMSSKGRRTYDSLKITKPVDSASVHLWQCGVTNDPLPNVKIELIRNRDDAKEVYLTVELKNAVVTSYRVNAPVEEDDEQPDEEVGLSFETISITYTTAGLKGSSPSNLSGEDQLFQVK